MFSRKFENLQKALIFVAISTTLLTLSTLTEQTSAAMNSTSKITVNTKSTNWAVTSLEVFPKDYKSATANWLAVPGYSSYYIERSTTSDFKSPTSNLVTGLSLDITGLTAETTYYFRSRPKDAPILSWSPTITATTPKQAATVKSMFLPTSDPHGVELDNLGRIWNADYKEGLVRQVLPNGAISQIGPIDILSTPRQISMITNDMALVVRSYQDKPDSRAGVYTLTSSGVYTLRVQFEGIYGTAYDSKRNKVFASHGKTLSECDYVTWVCRDVLNLPGGVGYITMTPDGSKVVMAGASGNIISTYDVNTSVYRTLVNTPNMDVRGAIAIGNHDYLAASWKTGDVWHVQVDPITEAVSVTTVITGALYPRSMAYDSNANILYLASSGAPTGVYKYSNLIR